GRVGGRHRRALRPAGRGAQREDSDVGGGPPCRGTAEARRRSQRGGPGRMNARSLGNRKVKLALGWLLGCVVGVLLALPFALWSDVTQARPQPAAQRASAERLIAAGLGVAAVFGGAIGMALTYLLTTLPGGRRRIALHAVLGALLGALLGGL